MGTAPDVSVPQQAQWVSSPPPTQGYTTQQTWAQPVAPTPAPVADPTPTPAPAQDFGSAPPAFGDAPAAATPPAATPVDTDRPLRRKK